MRMMEILKKRIKHLKRKNIKTEEIKDQNKMLLKKISDMNAIIERLNDNKQKLTEENRTLKQDLERERRISEEKTESLRMMQAEGRRKEAELRDMERSLNISTDYVDRNLDLSAKNEELQEKISSFRNFRKKLSSANYKYKQEIKRLRGQTQALEEAQERDQKTIKSQMNIISIKEKILERKSRNLAVLLASIKENISLRMTPEMPSPGLRENSSTR